MKLLHYKQREIFTGYLFILPVLLGVLLLSVYPLLLSLYNSFFAWDAITPRKFIGFENFQWMFTVDKQVITSFKATGTYLLFHVPAVVIGGLFVAVLLNRPGLRGLRPARTIMFTPLIVTPVAIAAIWIYVFNPNVGLVNTIIQEWFGGEGINWFGKPVAAMFVLLVVSIWRGIGYSFVFLLAGLQGIPVNLYEAAKIDGANGRQLFRHITLPLLTPSLFLVLVLVFLGAAQEFELPLVLTNGGPRFSTSLINLTIYKNAFQYTSMGYASAIASIAFIVLLVGTIFQFIFQRRWVFYIGEQDR